MQLVDLNLAPRPFRNNMVLWVALGLAVLGLSSFTAWSVEHYRSSSQELTELRQQLGSYDARRREFQQRGIAAQQGIRGFDIDSLWVRATKANEVIDRKAFSWTRLFNRLAEILPFDTKLTSIRPVFQGAGGRDAGFSGRGENKRVPVMIQATAKDWGAFTELEEALNGSAYFGDVQPERADTTSNGEVVFRLAFLYYPEATPDKPLPDELDAEAGIEGATMAQGDGPETALDTDADAAGAEGEAGEGTPEGWDELPVVRRRGGGAASADDPAVAEGTAAAGAPAGETGVAGQADGAQVPAAPQGEQATTAPSRAEDGRSDDASVDPDTPGKRRGPRRGRRRR